VFSELIVQFQAVKASPPWRISPNFVWRASIMPKPLMP